MNKQDVAVRLCDGLWSKGTGLMFRFPKKPFAYIFPFTSTRRISITMAFVFYAIDVIALNEENKIISIFSLQPFSSKLLTCKTFIELPFGYTTKHCITLGQSVSWSKTSLSIA